MTDKTVVPFADLHAQYLTIKEEIDHAIAEVIRTSAFIRGPYVQKFEEEFAAVTGAQFSVSCANGTDSLYIAMRAIGVKQGDEVITAAHSWISTSETITQAGGNVVFCDTNKDSYTIDVAKLEGLITPRTVGIIPVHLYGHPADMPAIMKLARKHKLWVIEDCAQAHMARIGGRLVGSFGDAASYSFYPGKNLGAMGDAGAITTNDQVLAEKMSMFARHGGLLKGDHQIEGINSRLDGMQAAILSVKLPHLVEWTRKRQKIAAEYESRLSGVKGLALPKTLADCEHVHHLYVIQHEARDKLALNLKTRGIQTAINYPIALPFLPAYKRLGHVHTDFPNAHYAQERILSLPIYPEMTEEQLNFVEKTLKEFC